MRRARLGLLPFVALGGVALVSAWILNSMEAAQVTPPEASRHVPDFYMENFTSTTMDQQGHPRRRIQADYLAHFPDTDTNELSRPYLIMYRDGLPPWHVRSDRGWVSANGDVMLLLGKVHAWRDDANGRREIDVHTTDLRVLPNSDYGETDKPVIIDAPHSESRAIGMRAYLKQSRLELLSQVRTFYDKARD